MLGWVGLAVLDLRLCLIYEIRAKIRALRSLLKFREFYFRKSIL